MAANPPHPFPDAAAVVPVFNGAATLRQCLGSLTQQNGRLAQIVVIDDGSRDASNRIIKEEAKTDSRIRFVIHPENQGISRTLNEGISQASASAVLIVHQDCDLPGSDWTERALRALEANPSCTIVGSPEFPVEEMSTTEKAFGLLRDSFFSSDAEVEDIGFSEFKCDLVPREALAEIPFDTRFRASGEDQVLSVALRFRGYRIVRVRSLRYIQRFGNLSRIRTQIRKEASYGKAEGGILVRTALGAASESAGARTSRRRLVNRASSFVSAFGVVVLAVLAGIGANPFLFLLPLVPIVFRAAMLLARDRRLRPRYALGWKAVGLALALMVPDDLVYSGSVCVGLVSYIVTRRV